MARHERISGKPPFCSCAEKNCTISCVCLANSRDGQMIRPYGPSLRTNGMLISCSRQNMMSGSTNTIVLPEPVNAMPIRSRPASTVGMPCTWMGVGFLMPFLSSPCRMGFGNFISLKERIGAGISSPSTRMRSLSRISSSLACGRAVMWRGGRQLVSIGSS